jgi:hypothetical protein
MKKTRLLLLTGFAITLLMMSQTIYGSPTENDPATQLYKKPAGVQTRWASGENPQGRKGAGAQDNKGAKGHAFDAIPSGATHVLCDIKGSGTIRRIWITLKAKNPHMLRAQRIDMYFNFLPLSHPGSGLFRQELQGHDPANRGQSETEYRAHALCGRAHHPDQLQ